MSGNYLHLHQPKVGELFEVLKNDQSSYHYSKDFFNTLERQNTLDSIPWALNRISHTSSVYKTVWNYLDNFRGARFEIQSHMNGAPEDLTLRLLASKEIPGEFNLHGRVVMPETLEELYSFTKENKMKVLVERGKPSWEYSLNGIIKKMGNGRCLLEFQ